VTDIQKAYEKAEKGKKIDVAQKVVDIVFESSKAGRRDCWLAVDNDSAHTKVSAAFRTLRIRVKG
jgi:hypothetical protein